MFRPVSYPTTCEFWDRCKSHDWQYLNSDDHSKYEAGLEEQRRLYWIAAVSPDLAPIFEAWWAYAYHGGPKPVRPAQDVIAGLVPRGYDDPDQMPGQLRLAL